MPRLSADLRPSWIAFGWFIAAALTALVLLALMALELVTESLDPGATWVAAAFAIGFGLAGFIVGTRVAAAPIAHGLGIGLFSLLVWVAVNLVLGEPTDQTAWSELDAVTAVGLLVLQTAAAVAGARIGVRRVRGAAAARG